MRQNHPYLIVFLAILLIGSFSSCDNLAKKTGEDTKVTTTTEPTKPTAPAEKSPIKGIDVSKYQHSEIDEIDEADSLSFIICKATEGITYVDPKFKQNWDTIIKKGYIRGAYHFYHTDDDPIKQAQAFTNAANFEDTDIPPIIDFEGGSLNKTESKRKPVEEVQADLLACLKEIQKITGRKPMIYTNGGTGNVYLNNEKFATYPLWVANYPRDMKTKNPEMPGIWKGTKWLFWQKSQTYKIDGMGNDFDMFNGTISALKAFIKSTKK